MGGKMSEGRKRSLSIQWAKTKIERLEAELACLEDDLTIERNTSATLRDGIEMAAELHCDMKAQLTAAEEQLAEMREALEACASGDEWKEVEALTNSLYSPVEFARQVCRELLDEFSAAPRRGRVIWEGAVRLEEFEQDELEMLAEDGNYIGELWPGSMKADLKGGQAVTVTVREAE